MNDHEINKAVGSRTYGTGQALHRVLEARQAMLFAAGSPGSVSDYIDSLNAFAEAVEDHTRYHVDYYHSEDN